MSGDDNGTWDSCKMFVLNELKRMNDLLAKMDDDIATMSNKLTILSVKMAFIGAAAGIVVSAIFSIIVKVAVK